ncbi:MAG: invasion associated locus B family protein [Geminicoccaceae bacterium]
MLAVLLASTVAMAQATDPAGDAIAMLAAPERATPAPVAWLPQCTSQGRSTPLACRIEQRLIVEETGQAFLTLTVHAAGGDAPPVLAIQTPLGLFLPPGLILRVGDEAPISIPVTTCDANGCHATRTLDDALLATFQAGGTLDLVLHTAPDQTLAVPIPLAGFATAYAAIR